LSSSTIRSCSPTKSPFAAIMTRVWGLTPRALCGPGPSSRAPRRAGALYPRLAWFAPWDSVGASRKLDSSSFWRPKAPARPGLFFAAAVSSLRTPSSRPHVASHRRVGAPTLDLRWCRPKRKSPGLLKLGALRWIPMRHVSLQPHPTVSQLGSRDVDKSRPVASHTGGSGAFKIRRDESIP
jgi:hypothetical protein